MKILFVLFIALYSLFIVPSLSAAEIGTLTLGRGIVRIRRGHWDTVHKTAYQLVEVHEADTIYTGADTQVSLRMPSIGHDVNIYSKSAYTVPKSRNRVSSTVLFGKIRFLIDRLKLAFRKRVTVKTSTAVIGVKGTDFIVGVRGGETGLVTIEGLVGFANPRIPEMEVEVGRNQVSRTVENEPPQAPVAIERERVESLILGDDASSVVEVSRIEEEHTAEVGREESGETDSAAAIEEERERVEDIRETVEEVEETSEEIEEDEPNDPEGGVTITIEE